MTLTPQQAFNKAVAGVLAQGKPSMSSRKNCRYRGQNGMRCAIGFLIEDDDLARRLDRGPPLAQPVYAWPKERFARAGISPSLQDMLASLQDAHDIPAINDPDRFLAMFRARAFSVAENFGLDTKVLEA